MGTQDTASRKCNSGRENKNSNKNHTLNNYETVTSTLTQEAGHLRRPCIGQAIQSIGVLLSLQPRMEVQRQMIPLISDPPDQFNLPRIQEGALQCHPTSLLINGVCVVGVVYVDVT